jgi:hypothetical protein
MVAWLKKILRWLGVLRYAGTPASVTRAVTPPVTRTVTPPVTRPGLPPTAQGSSTAALDGEMLTVEHIRSAIERYEALRAERIKMPGLRKTPKRLRRENADRQARHRAKLKAEDPEGFRQRKREEDAARRARKKAAKAAAAAQAGSQAAVIDLQRVRAARAETQDTQPAPHALQS